MLFAGLAGVKHLATQAVLDALDRRETVGATPQVADEGNVPVPGVTGTVVRKISTETGEITRRRQERLTTGRDARRLLVIDLAETTNAEGTVFHHRPVLAMIDLADYIATKPGAQGGVWAFRCCHGRQRHL